MYKIKSQVVKNLKKVVKKLYKITKSGCNCDIYMILSIHKLDGGGVYAFRRVRASG